METIAENDLIIDGETEIDDLLVAARIAELECMKVQVLHEPFHPAPRSQRWVEEEESDSDGGGDADTGEKKLGGGHQQEIEELKQIISDSTDVSWEEDGTEEGGGGGTEREFQKTGAPESWSGIANLEISGLPVSVSPGYPVEAAGRVHAILQDTMIVISASPQKIVRPLDLGSILCLADRSILGPVCDTFGPVTSPFYVVYVSSQSAEVLTEGTEVFYDVLHSSFLFETADQIPEYLQSGKIDGDAEDSEDEEDCSELAAAT
eukprot:GHVS01105680.1.p1 GENE.GHVS01105680.1~~GHVS01105680.1.p1  ORF type:complete len:263 (+),score=54.64 GHVS01105680.1:145-933(+)